MILTIARREIAEAVGTGRAPLLFVLVVILLGTGMLALRKDYQARLDAYSLVRPNGDEPAAMVPPSPLSVFGRGLDDAMGRRFTVNPIGIEVGQTQASANPLFDIFPTPDWLFLFRVVLALLAFLAGYDLICREKARGTLKLLLAGGASRASIALGKWVGNWLALVVPVLLAALLWLVLARPLFGLHFRPGDGAAIAAFLGLGIAYLTVCFTLAAAISALFHDQTTALVTALLAWATLVFVIPSVGVLVARQTVHVRPLALVESERRQIFGREMLEALEGLRSGGGLPPAERQAMLRSHWLTVHQEGDRLGEQAAAEAGHLARVAEAVIRVSPAGAFEAAATRVLGTSIDDEAALKRRVLEYKDQVLPSVFDATLGGDAGPYPAFTPPRRSVSRALHSRGADLLALTLAGIASMLVFLVAVRRYDVR